MRAPSSASTDVQVGEAVCRIDREQARKCPNRVGRAARGDVRIAERDERVRVIVRKRGQKINRAASLTGLGHVLPELDADFALGDAVLERGFQRRDCQLRLVRAPVGQREVR